MSRFYNDAWMTTATTGTGTITLGSAVSGYVSFSSAGIADGDQVSYTIVDGTARESGFGTYTASGTTLTRNLVTSTTGALISLSGSATVFITALATDLIQTVRWTAAGGESSKSFTIPSGWNTLVFEIAPRTSAASGNVYMRFNSDSGANYDFLWTYAVNGTTSITSNGAQAQIQMPFVTGTGASSTDRAGRIEATISDYAGSSWMKTGFSRSMQVQNTTTTAWTNMTEVFNWRNAAAITNVTFTLDTGTFVANSTINMRLLP